MMHLHSWRHLYIRKKRVRSFGTGNVVRFVVRYGMQIDDGAEHEDVDADDYGGGGEEDPSEEPLPTNWFWTKVR